MSTHSQDGAKTAPGGEEEEDDDYMNMTFQDPTPSAESSYQRTQRLKKESRQRGVIKSKAEKAQEEEAARQKALSTSLLDSAGAKKSKGLAMMSKMGFTGGGLGRKDEQGNTQGRAEPIQVSIKEDRGGVGLANERKRQLEEAAQEMVETANKAVKLDPDEYRERMRKEREDAKMEKQLFAAQRMAERLDEGSGEEKSPRSDEPDERDRGKKKTNQHISSRPLKSIPVLYRGLVRHREETERDRRMRHDLEQSLPRLPTYEEDDDDFDDDDRTALDKNGGTTAISTYLPVDDLDEEDEELDHFNQLESGERLTQLLAYLRTEHQYCFWCKMAYPDKEMEGCPGVTEEEHD